MKKQETEQREYESWNKQKQQIHFSPKKKNPFFRVGEIRWAYLGKNIHSEIFGKGEHFARPILIFKTLYQHSALVIPLTSQEKKGSYYFSFTDTKNKQFTAIFSQIKYMDGSRAGSKISNISKTTFQKIEQEFVCFIKNIPR